MPRLGPLQDLPEFCSSRVCLESKQDPRRTFLRRSFPASSFFFHLCSIQYQASDGKHSRRDLPDWRVGTPSLLFSLPPHTHLLSPLSFPLSHSLTGKFTLFSSSPSFLSCLSSPLSPSLQPIFPLFPSLIDISFLLFSSHPFLSPLLFPLPSQAPLFSSPLLPFPYWNLFSPLLFFPFPLSSSLTYFLFSASPAFLSPLLSPLPSLAPLFSYVFPLLFSPFSPLLFPHMFLFSPLLFSHLLPPFLYPFVRST